MGRTGKMRRQLRRIATSELRKAARGTVAEIVIEAERRENKAQRRALRLLVLRVHYMKIRYKIARLIRRIRSLFGGKR